jgi:protein SCO1
VLKKYSAVVIIAAILLPLGVVAAQEATPDPLIAVRFDQKLDSQVPLDLAFRDERGQRVLTGQFFGEKPVILVLAYYECPMLCTLVLNGLTDSLAELDFDAGMEFEIVTISIDPNDTPELAYEKKETYLAEYNRPGAEQGWHFLTGDQHEIDKIADAVGFRYIYQGDVDQYAHPAGIVLATPEGRVSHYFFGIEFNSADLRLGLVEASQNKIGNMVDQFYLLCYAYDPETGTYGLLIQNVLQIAGVGTVLIAAGAILLMVLRERKGGQDLNEVSR